jgi:hypothetical protein
MKINSHGVFLFFGVRWSKMGAEPRATNVETEPARTETAAEEAAAEEAAAEEAAVEEAAVEEAVAEAVAVTSPLRTANSFTSC